MKRLIHILPVAFVFFFINTVGAADQITGTDKEQIAQLYEAYHSRWLSNDEKVPEAIMSLFADDAVLLPDDGLDMVVGKQAISDWWFPEGQVTGTVEVFSHSDTTIKFSETFGSAYGRFELSFTIDGEVTSTEGNQLMLAQKIDGQWKITAVTWNSVPPEDPS